MERGPLDPPGDSGNGKRSPAKRSRRLTRHFIALAVLVAVVSFAWSELTHDPVCTEGPCAQDVPLILGAMVETALAVVYFLAMGVLAVKEYRGHAKQDRRER